MKNVLLDIERLVTSLLVNRNHHHGEHAKTVIIEETVVEAPTENNGFILEVNNIKVTAYGDIKMAFQLKDTQFTTIHAVPKDRVGNRVSGETTLTWTSSDSSIVSVAASADTLSAVVTAAQVGSATVNVSFGGVTASFDIDVVSGDVATIALSAEPAAEVQAPAAPAPTDAPAPAPADAAPAPATDASAPATGS